MNWSRDLTFAIRQIRNAPGFAASAIATLGFGIGMTAAIFTVANAVLFRPLPFANADRLVRIVEEPSAAGQGVTRVAQTALDLAEMALVVVDPPGHVVQRQPDSRPAAPQLRTEEVVRGHRSSHPYESLRP